MRTRGGYVAPPRRLPPRRAAAIHETGRVAVAAAPAAAVFLLLASRGTWEERAATALVQALIWGIAVGAARTWGGAALTALGPRVAAGRGVLVAAVASTAASVWLPYERHTPMTLLIIPVAFAGTAAWETLARRRITPAIRLLLVGMSSQAETLVHDIRRGHAGGYELVGVVVDSQTAWLGMTDSPLVGTVEELSSLIATRKPDLVVLTTGFKRPETLHRLLDVAEAGFRVLEFAEFYEYAFGRVPTENLPHEWFMSVLHLYQRGYSRLLKRTVDLTGALLLTILTLPLFPLLALLVRQTEGPVILRQVRMGENGKLFTIYKFRTMRVDAEQPGRAVWAMESDPRITPTGRFMRQLRLDELPQLWNVLRGDMSLVGPRPERPEFLDELSRSVPYWTRRHLVKPGLTGWAQVRQGYVNSADATATKLSYDLWYLRHRNLTVDLAILLRTVFVVIRGDRAPAASGARADAAAAGASD